MPLWPPVRVTAGVNGGKPLKGGSSTGLIVTQLSLTVAQLQAAQATVGGYPIIPAQAGKIIVPIWFAFNERRVNAFTSTPTFRLVRTSDGSIANSLSVVMQAGTNSNIYSLRSITPVGNTQININTSYAGVGLNVLLSTALTGSGSYASDPIFTVAWFAHELVP